jgi:RNA polymerase sigma-70 factor (ECF subfamily)
MSHAYADDDSVGLIRRAQGGDAEALDALLRRYLPRVRRWAAGRLPVHARGLLDTDDIVQETLTRTVRNVRQFEPRHEHSLELYLRQAVANRIRDALRHARRAPRPEAAEEHLEDDAPSSLDRAIVAESVAKYRAALTRLGTVDREAVVARLELGYSYREVAALIGKPSPDAARVAVERAILRLADAMRHA